MRRLVAVYGFRIRGRRVKKILAIYIMKKKKIGWVHATQRQRRNAILR
jgi:hypothetical protein